jgi:hypothetical protein
MRYKTWASQLVMKPFVTLLCAFVIALSAGAQGATNQHPETKRRLIHTFAKPGFAEVMVVLIDYPAGPQCVVLATRMDRTKTKRAVPVSTRQFNKIWVAFQASGADKYMLGESPGGFDGTSNYFFIVGNQMYVVPKNKASPVLTSLVTELRGYAK